MEEDKSTWLAGLADAAKGAWMGLEASAIIASSPGATIVENAGIQLADPFIESGITALADTGEALQSAVGARSDGEDIGEATDVDRPVTTSLMVDPPSWIADPSTDWGMDTSESGDASNATGL